ncbi:hypothetical protein [Halobacillus mangrovi]|uniref:hypothetical protein n=1 Tax=Halobacillus mangrovi TaxID=402384 RepID=UPI003D9646BF
MHFNHIIRDEYTPIERGSKGDGTANGKGQGESGAAFSICCVPAFIPSIQRAFHLLVREHI